MNLKKTNVKDLKDIKVTKASGLVLLGHENPKTIKGEKMDYITYTLNLMPYKFSGYNTCASASKECAANCLHFSGNPAFMNTKNSGRLRKTLLFFEQRELFFSMLRKDIDKIIAHAAKNDYKFSLRLNTTSDIRWELFKSEAFENKNVFEYYNEVQFYDYTKHTNRIVAHITNYHLTFSRSEVNGSKIKGMLEMGYNVASVTSIPFDQLPNKIGKFNVINGDDTDLRFLDKKNSIVILKFKRNTGNKTAEKPTNFVISELSTLLKEVA
jgi:hypothetical protein